MHAVDPRAAGLRASQPPQAGIVMPFVRRLKLTDFRCYTEAVIETDDRPVVLVGENGAGKTNLLEALSYLVPGRGLRGAKLSEVGRIGAASAPTAAPLAVQGNWAIAAQVENENGVVDVGTGLQSTEQGGRETRAIKIDGKAERGQAALGAILSAVWLTPAMDRLFLEGASGRRRFVDRIVIGVDPEHAGALAAYEQSLRNRNRLLRDGNFDATWMNAVEDSMSRHGVAVAARRREAVSALERFAVDGRDPFPSLDVAMSGDVEAWLATEPALAVEDRLRDQLAEKRYLDGASGTSSVGPHRSDFEVHDARSGMPAAQCSTGEQKAMLITLILAAARMLAFQTGRKPLLLLDEITAHLDDRRRAALFEMLVDLGCQTWMTGTDPILFSPLGARAQHFSVRDASVEPQGFE